MAAANNMASARIVLEPLRQGNYENWSTLVRSYLVGKGLWEGIVDFGPPRRDGGEINDDEWTSKNAKALHAIQLACGSENLSKIRTFEDARDAWNHLNISFSEVLETEPEPEPEPESEYESEIESEAESEPAVFTWIKELHSVVKKGKWKDAKAYILEHGYAATSSTRPSSGRTILHVAVASGRERIVKDLLSMGNHNERQIQQLLRMQDKRGYTALALAAELTDNKDVAEWMIHKGGRKLLTIKTKDKGETPVLLASAKGHKQMTRYLFYQTRISDLRKSNDEDRVQAVKLLTRCISAEIFDVARTLILLKGLESPLRHYKDGNERHPIMALAHMPSAFRSGAQLGWWNRFIYNSLRLQIHSNETGSHDEPADEEASTSTSANLRTTHRLGRIFRSMVSAFVPVKPLCRRFGQLLPSVLGVRILPGGEKIYEMKQNHDLLHGILERLSEVISKCDETDPLVCSAYDVMLLAAKYGIIELIDSLRLRNPSLLLDMNDNKKNILAHAISHRQEKVFQLILRIRRRQKEILISHTDSNDSNMLHLAAELGPSSYLNRMSNPALQMQRELQWFNAVERIVLPRYKEAKNIHA